jgi:hypothetical protein
LIVHSFFSLSSEHKIDKPFLPSLFVQSNPAAAAANKVKSDAKRARRKETGSTKPM